MRRFPIKLLLLALTFGPPTAFALTESLELPLGAEPAATALDGDTLVVGAPYAAVGAQQQAGRIFVYLRDAANWIGPVEVSPTDRAAFDEAGKAVAISGDTLVIGSPRHNNDQGAVYVFIRDGGGWTPQATLTAAAGVAGDRFGTAVSITGDTLVIGAPGADTSHVFQRASGIWIPAAALTAADGAAGDGFGCAVAAAGDSALIGAPWHGINHTGAAYVYKSAAGDWTNLTPTKLPITVPADAHLGHALDLADRVALLGAPGENNATGAGYIAFYNGATWSQQARLADDGGTPGDRLGDAVNLGGEQADIALLGIPGAGPGPREGKLNLYLRQGTTWNASADNPLTAAVSGVNRALGHGVGLFGDTAVGVAPGAEAAYIYRFDCGFGRDWIKSVWLFGGVPCHPAPPTVQDQLGDDFDSAQYGANKRWIVYDWNETGKSWTALTLTSPLSPGVGLQHKTLDGVRIDLIGTATQPTPSAHCPASAGCFEIPLIPTVSGETYKANLIGHPFPYPVDWADVRFVQNDTAYTPSGAHAANIAYKHFKRYNGNAYESYDDTTPGLNGNLWPNESVWVYLKPGAISGIQLLIPAQSSRQTTVKTAAVLEKRLERRIQAVQADTLDANLKTARLDAIRRQPEWSVQLILETADGLLADPANVLGQLADAEDGYDAHDLIERDPQTPLPPDGPQLSLVFPHPDWNTEAGDYNSDYHAFSAAAQTDAWDFEVRGNQTGLLRLRWQVSQPDALARGRLIDMETGATVPVGETEHYEFRLTGGVRVFRWEWLPNTRQTALGE
ncbi:MAG TPA: FG-GAP repeat protein [Candidatus Competibacter sp.]|nr:FG-GAP repeat protein [Candidatus Competibacteraceae bacterium]HPE70976.1 FG-GAP repeat protein [Candidatus Competibacter sp.]